MVLQLRRAVSRRLHPLCALLVMAPVALSGCDKAPLLAPSGTVIFLTATPSTVGSTGQVDIIAVLLEQGTTSTGTGTGTTTTPATGTPVHNGTVVTFTSTIGRVEPAEARTENGQVRVKFIGDGRSGTATILAFSGGARTELTLPVGAAAAERVLVSATALGSSGGSSTVTAKVEDVSGNPLPGVSVQFSTTSGTLSAQSATTDATGVATVTLTTTSAATVTAAAGSKSGTATVTPATRSGLAISVPSTVTASAPAQFTFTLSNPAGVQTVLVNWGDGTATREIGANASSSQSHTFPDAGDFVVTATARMTDGTSETPVRTSVFAGAFQVGISASNPQPTAGNIVTFTATVTPNTVNVLEYRWDFGDGTDEVRTDGPVATHTYNGAAGQEFIARVTVVPVTGRSRTNTTVIRMQ